MNFFKHSPNKSCDIFIATEADDLLKEAIMVTVSTYGQHQIIHGFARPHWVIVTVTESEFYDAFYTAHVAALNLLGGSSAVSCLNEANNRFLATAISRTVKE